MSQHADLKITMVKKVMVDGSPCKKCGDVSKRLEESGYLAQIDRIVIADAANPESEGMQLATQYNVDKAPFFIVEKSGEAPQIYTIYFKLVKEVLQAADNN